MTTENGNMLNRLSIFFHICIRSRKRYPKASSRCFGRMGVAASASGEHPEDIIAPASRSAIVRASLSTLVKARADKLRRDDIDSISAAHSLSSRQDSLSRSPDISALTLTPFPANLADWILLAASTLAATAALDSHLLRWTSASGGTGMTVIWMSILSMIGPDSLAM